VRIPAKADYAIRALVELAAISGLTPGTTRSEAKVRPVSADKLAAAQGIAAPFLAGILSQLRLSGLVRSVRGPEGGFLLARPAREITIADVIRAIDGPLATLSGQFPDALEYPGAAAPLREVWVAVRASMRTVLEHTTIADVAANKLPAVVRRLISDDDAWQRR
jgi:Rrf2 family protein